MSASESTITPEAFEELFDETVSLTKQLAALQDQLERRTIAIETALDFTPFAVIEINGERMYLLSALGKHHYLVLRGVDDLRVSPAAQRRLSKRAIDLLPGYDAASWEITS